MKYVAILDSLDELSEEAIEQMKNVVFSGGGEQAPWCFDITSIEKVKEEVKEERIEEEGEERV